MHKICNNFGRSSACDRLARPRVKCDAANVRVCGCSHEYSAKEVVDLIQNTDTPYLKHAGTVLQAESPGHLL